MKIVSFAKKAAVVAILSGAGVAANAAVVGLGTLAVGTTNFNNATYVTLSDPALGATFLDALVFNLPANAGSSYGVIDFPLDLSATVPGLTFNSIFNFVQVRSAGLDGVALTADDVELGGGVIAPTTTFSFNLGAGAGGTAYLLIGGVTPIGSVGSLYNGSITVTAVPEPESYAMLLAGLGVMGAIAVRRKSKKQD